MAAFSGSYVPTLHAAEQTKSSVDIAVSKQGKCLKHPDVTLFNTNMFGMKVGFQIFAQIIPSSSWLTTSFIVRKSSAPHATNATKSSPWSSR
jgi:hypothetical protein